MRDGAVVTGERLLAVLLAKSRALGGGVEDHISSNGLD